MLDRGTEESTEESTEVRGGGGGGGAILEWPGGVVVAPGQWSRGPSP